MWTNDISSYCLCVSGGATVIDYTAGGGTGADLGDGQRATDGVDNPHHHASNEYINGHDNQIKKNDDKIDTAV